MDERTVTPHKVVFSLLLWLLFLLRALNKQTGENRSSILLVSCPTPRIWRWRDGRKLHRLLAAEVTLGKRKRRNDELAMKSYRELIRKITHDWYLRGIFSPGRRNVFLVSISDHEDIVSKWLYYRLNYQSRKELMLPASFLPSRPCLSWIPTCNTALKQEHGTAEMATLRMTQRRIETARATKKVRMQ